MEGITPDGHAAIWRDSMLLSDSGLRTGLSRGIDVRPDGSGGLVEQQAEVLLAAGVGSDQLRLVCSVLQCCGLPYHPASRLGVGPVVWEHLDGPAECERVAIEARGSSIRARLLLAAVESLESRSTSDGAVPLSTASSAGGGPESVERAPATADSSPAGASAGGSEDSNRLVQGVGSFRPIRASHIGAAAEALTRRFGPYGSRPGLELGDLPDDYFEPICETCHRNIASDMLGGMECWECYGEH